MKRRILPLLFAAIAAAHPMGNFSVSHFTRLEVSAKGVDVTYVLDLAEIPTYQLFKDWGVDAKSPGFKEKAAEQARAQAITWMDGLEFRSGGERVQPKLVSAEIRVTDGAGGLPVSRIASTMRLERVKGTLEFEDHNFPERAGWKEIVIGGAAIVKASQSNVDRSKELTEYPADPTLAPPQDLRASVEWRMEPVTTRVTPTVRPIEQPKPAATQASTPTPTSSSAAQAPGTVVRGDYLSRMLGQKEIGLGLMLIGVAVAFGLGAVHALSPGHGKTIVAAYLVGSRGTAQHAMFLGGMVTFTHTISVFALGLATLFISKYIVPEKIIPVLGAISGMSIVVIGGSLLWKRAKRLQAAESRVHGHHHHHDHVHNHDHDHAHEHHHDHDEHDHHHGPGGHTHVPEGDITLGSLIALGASGGLVPCPSALVLLLSAIAVGHVGLGLVLLVSFSMGLAVVLMAIGLMVLYAKHLLPDPVSTSKHPLFKLVPVLSAFVIVCLGLLMTGVSLGWVRPGFAG